MKVVRELLKISKPALIIGGLLLLCMVGFLDYFTGYELSFSLFYLIPIALLSWVTNSKTGIVIAILSAGIWLAADVGSGAQYSSDAIFFWNTLIRLGFFLLIVLLTGVAKSLEREKEFARTDFLTGAVNTRYFNELTQMEIDRSNRYHHSFTIAFIDVDDFKSINDKFGHSVGDKVLGMAVSAMQKTLRKTDVVGRMGGDEFAVLLPETNEDVAQIVISKMQERLLDEMTTNRWTVTFSIGVATFTTPPESVDEALSLSDKLMYSVKNSGKNNVCYTTNTISKNLERADGREEEKRK